MITVTHMTGGNNDRTPDAHLPIALLACGEEYANLDKAFDAINPEIEDIRRNGLPCVHVLCACVQYALLICCAAQGIQYRPE